MITKLLLGLLLFAAVNITVQSQLCGPGGIIRGATVPPLYVAPPVVYVPAAPPVIYAPAFVYAASPVYPSSVVYTAGYGGYGYHPRLYSAPVHYSIGFGHYGSGHWSGGFHRSGHGWRRH